MVHGDDSGLVLPPKIAPTQVMVIPIQQQKDGVLDKAYDLKDKLSKDFRVKIDATDKTPGWKFASQEVQGISTRIEISPKDIEKTSALSSAETQERKSLSHSMRSMRSSQRYLRRCRMTCSRRQRHSLQAI